MSLISSSDQLAFQDERLTELKGTLSLISNMMVLPLYFLFWACDLIFVPELKWEFLFLRAMVLPACLLVQILLKKIYIYHQGQWLALFFIYVLASIINAMIIMIGHPDTAYYAGLNLVAIGSLTFIPWTWPFFALAAAGIFGPYIAFSLYSAGLNLAFSPLFLVNCFFITGTVVISSLIRHFHEKLRQAEFKSRLQLNDEIGNRDQIIIEKTEEGMRLASLGAQFSPQIVGAIREKKINLNTAVHRSKICAIFIDIVNSTERVARVDKDKVHNVISMFMDDSIKALLKYDITIDKFLGDGILAFSNDPMPQTNFAERVLYAAHEIRKKTNDRIEFYEDNWLSPLQVRIGIAVGYANVGFYGHERFFKSYTAIGPVVNLASRLCSAAQPGKIVAASDYLEHIDPSFVKLNPLGKVKLKGFEADVIKAFEIELSEMMALSNITNSEDCPACKSGLLQLATNSRGIYILKCLQCGHEVDDQVNSTKAA